MAAPRIDHVTWLGHDGFKIVAGGKVIVIDPFQLKPPQEPADVVLITHEHFDHCSPNDLKLVVKPTTTIMAAISCGSELAAHRVVSIKPGDRQEVDGLLIEAVPAYNLNKDFHPQGEARVGFVVTVEGQRIYHAGDSDATPEMLRLSDIDIALVPVSGTYVMTAEEAADAVNTFKPKIAIPMHYGAIIGSRADAERFRDLARVPVSILEPAGQG